MKSVSPRKLRWVRLAAVLLALLFCYGITILYRGAKMYQTACTDPRGWTGNIMDAHPKFGPQPRPLSQGEEVYVLGPGVPTQHDEEGRRIPKEPLSPERDGVILTLGDSFTYGSGCPADESYPFVVGKSLKMETVNAGQCGTGLAHLYLTGQELIPKLKPKYLVIQFSTWLTLRSSQPFTVTSIGAVPTPYFAEQSLEVQPPVYQTTMFDYNFGDYRNTKPTLLGGAWFILTRGGPFLIGDDIRKSGFYLGKALGFYEPPSSNDFLMVDKVYPELVELARKNGAEKIVLVVIGPSLNENQKKYFEPLVDSIVDTNSLLNEALAQSGSNDFAQAYYIVRGQPPIVVDQHYSAGAHRVIADGVVKALDP